jgi:hypothetical protein
MRQTTHSPSSTADRVAAHYHREAERPIARKSLADRPLIVAGPAYVCVTWLIEPGAPPFDEELVAHLVKLGALIRLGLARAVAAGDLVERKTTAASA